MSGLKIGSLFSGYGGLDMGVQAALGGSVAWHVEFDKAPSKILAHHWPDVPNYGDVTSVDWSAVEPVDIITGGSPCQDLSHAGKRQGMTEGTRSNLWVAMREAIAQLRPGLVVWENVRGAYSAAADSEVEPCAGCVGERPGVSLRALGRVLGDLSDLGYDCRWHGLRAADVGAPHGRFRVFVVAYPRLRAGHGEWARPQLGQGGSAAAVTANLGHERAGTSQGRWAGPADSHRGVVTDAASDASIRRSAGRTTDAVSRLRSGDGDDPAVADRAQQLLPTPRATDGTKGGPNQRGSSGDLMLPSAVTLLPTPMARDYKGAGPADMERHDPNLSALPRLLPTPTSADSKASGAQGYNGNEFCTLTDATVRNPQNWGIYADAIARWETLTRPAPAPTQPSKKGTPQLSPAFSEWLMGLPEGHVTDVPGLSRNDMLKALGNGVVPQQATAALRFLLNVQERAA